MKEGSSGDCAMPEADERSLTERAAAAVAVQDEGLTHQAAERFARRVEVGKGLLRRVLGVVTPTEWHPFGENEAWTEVDGVFLTTGVYSSFGAWPDTLYFWRACGEGGNEKHEVRNLTTLGRYIERYGTDYRPPLAAKSGSRTNPE